MYSLDNTELVYLTLQRDNFRHIGTTNRLSLTIPHLQKFTLEVVVAGNQGCLKVKLIHMWSNLVTNVFMFPLPANTTSASCSSKSRTVMHVTQREATTV